MSEQEIRNELIDMFQNVQPDAEDMDDDEDLELEINEIQAMIDADTQPIGEQIKVLSGFNSEWFPDGLDAEEQAEYRALLKKAEAVT